MDTHFNNLDKQLNHQDWNQVIFKQSKSTKPIPSKKISTATQKDIKLLKQVDEDNLHHKKVSSDSRKIIQSKRNELKYTQKYLAQQCNLPVSIINDIETGKGIYNPQHINKIKRFLKL
jgi:ribosome-binding protein aMBF1 (putative translation factor)